MGLHDSNRRNKDYTPLILTACVLILISVVLVIVINGSGDKNPNDETLAPQTVSTERVTNNTTTGENVTTALTTKAEETTRAEETTKAEETSTNETTTKAEETTTKAPDDTTTSHDSTGGDISTLSNSVFIGDSRTDGLRIYTSLPRSGARIYCSVGLSVSTATTNAFIPLNGQNVTLYDALRADPSFSSVYISLGVNELGWIYPSVFIDKYGDMIDTIRGINPSCTIYVEEILPVTKAKSDSDDVFTRERVAMYNTLLEQMTAEHNVVFLRVGESVADGNGYLPAEASSDGIHLTKQYSQMWLDYIISHSK